MKSYSYTKCLVDNMERIKPLILPRVFKGTGARVLLDLNPSSVTWLYDIKQVKYSTPVSISVEWG